MLKTYSNSSKILDLTKGDRPLMYKAVYIDITGSKNAAILLYQILLWCDWMKGEFYKSDKDFSEMIGLTYDEFRQAKKTLKDLGYITVQQKGFPRKTFYSIGEEQYLNIRKSVCAQKGYEKSLAESSETTPVDNSSPVCGNSTLQSAGIPQTVHYIQRSLKNNPSIGKSRDLSVKEESKKLMEGDGLNQIRKEEEMQKLPYEQPVDNFNKITAEFDLDEQTKEFMKIWPDIPKKPGFKLVKEALRGALTKKTFSWLKEYAEDFVKAQRRYKQDEYITCAHTWLNQERWPKSNLPKTQDVINPYVEAVKESELKKEEEKRMRTEIQQKLILEIGEEKFNSYFHWKKCSISLKDKPIILLFEGEELKNEAEKYYSKIFYEVVQKVEGARGREIEFRGITPIFPTQVLDNFSSKAVLDEIKKSSPLRKRVA